MSKTGTFLGFSAGGCGVIVLLLVLSAGGIGVALANRWINLQVEGWFAPREANVQREVFENTKSFNEGKEQELSKAYREYMSGDADEKQGIKTYVRHTFADYDIERLAPELQNFVRDCRGY